MTLPALIHCKLATGQSEVETTLAAYTHTDGCGYRRAQQDPYNLMLVWYLADCPVEAVIDGVKAAITTFVVAAAAVVGSMDSPGIDVKKLVLSMIESVNDSAVKWLNDNTIQPIAEYLQQDNRIRGYILDELIAQGAVQSA